MWRVGLYDLVYRRRRFVLAVLATALAFGLSLLMSGAIKHLQNETERIVALFDADQFVVVAEGTGPFTTTRLLPETVVADLASQPGVERADGFVQGRETLRGKDVNVLGVVPGGLGAPEASSGRSLMSPGEAMTDTTLGFNPGDTIRLGDLDLTVVGTVADATYYFGQQTIFLSLAEAQQSFLGGQPYVTAIAVRGQVADPPAGTAVLGEDAVRDDLNRPQEAGTQTVQIINSLLWLMAVGIVATMVYLTALERSRDIAVLKAMGTGNGTLFAGMAVQGLALALAACAVGAVVARLLAPTFPFAVETPVFAYAQVLAVGIVVGLIAALIGLRRAVHIDPALAFGRQA